MGKFGTSWHFCEVTTPARIYIYGNGGTGMGTFQMWLTALLLGAVAQVNFVLILVFIVNLPFTVLIQLLTDHFLGPQLSV